MWTDIMNVMNIAIFEVTVIVSIVVGLVRRIVVFETDSHLAFLVLI